MALLAAVLLLLVAAGILAGVIIPTRQGSELPASAQGLLDHYLAHTLPASPAAVAAIDRAARPSRLAAGMAGQTFGASVHFQTDMGDAGIEAGGLSPLPFPPVQVWCVLLKDGGPPAGQVVLVALHEDLYNADWIVHQGADDASSVAAQHLLSTLGCTVTPEPGDFDALDRAQPDRHGSYASIRVPETFD